MTIQEMKDNIPEGYEYIKTGEILPKLSWYFNVHKSIEDIKNIDNWYQYKPTFVGETRQPDCLSIFVKKKSLVEKPKLQYIPITDFNIGDVFIDGVGTAIIIVEHSWNKNLYAKAGLGNSLSNYSSCPDGLNKEEMLKSLNSQGRIFLTNLNDKIAKTIKLGCEMLK